MSDKTRFTIEAPTGSQPTMPPIIVQQGASPPVGVIPNPSTPLERVSFRALDVGLCLIPAILIDRGKIPALWGIGAILFLGGPPEIVRQVIKLLRVLNERTLAKAGVRPGSDNPAASSGSFVAILTAGLAGYTKYKAAGGAIALAGLLGAACVGCVPWEREPCTDPGSWSCINDQPHFCTPETVPRLTPVGNEPCSAQGRVCARSVANDSHSRTYCAQR